VSSGWIKLHRNLIEWEWYTDHNTCRLFIHCILRANHADQKWRGIDIKRGSFYTSLDTLSEETGLSPMQIRTSLKKLKSTGEVTGYGMARGRIITVVEYDSYQDDNRLSNSLVTGSQQAGNRVVTANKNDNKDNKEKKEKKGFAIPEQKELSEYFISKGSTGFEAERFLNYYISNGWMVGKNKMKSWQGAAGGWISRNAASAPAQQQEHLI